MGYATQNSGLLLGLGVSSISDVGIAFAQNEKTLADYYNSINEEKIAVKRGHFLNEEDIAFRKYILDIACKGSTRFDRTHLPLLKQYTFPKLNQFASDGLVEYDEQQLKLTPEGHYFIRNICSAFDLYLQRDHSILNNTTFSKAI